MSELLPVVTEVESALNKLAETTAEMAQLESQLASLRVAPRPDRWPRPGPPKRVEWAGSRPPGSDLSPAVVVNKWNREGEQWLIDASRRELRAAAYALTTDEFGAQLLVEQSFVGTLVKRTSDSRRARLIAHVFFSRCPPKRWVYALAKQYFDTDGPPWWRQVFRHEAQLRPAFAALASLVSSGELRAEGDLELPPVFWTSGFADHVCRLLPLRSISAVEDGIAFADGGRFRTKAPVASPVARVIERALEVAESNALPRREAAALCVRRVGSPFDAAASVRWSDVANGLPRVRAWLAGEVLRILFSNLAPTDRSSAHQTRPREHFWANYTGRVRKLWVLVPRSMRVRLDHPDVKKIREMLGNGLVVQDLAGNAQQSIIWMHLDGPLGIVTIAEGNANTSVRLTLGSFDPPRGTVNYGSHVLGGPLSSRSTTHVNGRQEKPFVQGHHYGWQEKVARALRIRGITPTEF